MSKFVRGKGKACPREAYHSQSQAHQLTPQIDQSWTRGPVVMSEEGNSRRRMDPRGAERFRPGCGTPISNP